METSSGLTRIIAKTFLIILFSFFSTSVLALEDSADYVKKGWVLRSNLEEVVALMDECVEKFGAEANSQAAGLDKMPKEDKVEFYKSMNDVATCLFIKGEAYMKAERNSESIAVFESIVEKYPFAQQWDPRGWFWSVKEKAVLTLLKLDPKWCDESPEKCEKPEKEIEFPISELILSDPGTEFPIDYEKYGTFEKVGTSDYRYLITDRNGLSAAVGGGVYPNTKSVRNDPEFQKIKKEIFKIDHWKILGSRDLKRAFYRWNFAPEPTHVRQFYIGDILERAGKIEQAIKAYYACITHFSKGYGKTYFDTPWYIAKAAIARITYLLDTHKEIGYVLKDASIVIEGGFDNDVSNDKFKINPGKFVKRSELALDTKRDFGKVVKSTGTNVKLVQYESGDWQLFVKEEPFIIKGVTFDPTRVGESPDDQTLEEWTEQDSNNNGIIDSPYETWVDKNYNNVQDSDEPVVGDFALMKRMGANVIRRYHQPHKPNKEILRDLYESYGIMTMMCDFLGKYTLGSGAPWEPGTDYRNPEHQKNMIESVKEMVNEHKDEPYLLMWLLGNENVYGVACNADKDPEGYFMFVNKVAKIIKEMDPTRPVGVVSGDLLYLDKFGELCPDVDVFGTNSYRGKYGFGDFWKDIKSFSGKAAMLTEYGVSSISNGYSKEEGEAYQAEYYRGTWNDIYKNSAGYGAGNSLGGVLFEWVDEWWKAYEPTIHDERGQFIGPFLDGYIHEEWLGVTSQGDGKSSPFLRQLKKAFFVYEDLWNKEG